MGSTKTLRVNERVRLHVEEGMSTSQIAKKFNILKNSVITSLRNRGVLRKALGRDVEEEVAQWYEKKGYVVTRQRGDAPFDLLINNEKYDVKSAHLSIDKTNYGSKSYFFSLQPSKEKLKDNEKEIDWFLLVFLDDDKVMYRVKSLDLRAKKSLHIHDIKTSSLPLQFVGILADRGGEQIMRKNRSYSYEEIKFILDKSSKTNFVTVSELLTQFNTHFNLSVSLGSISGIRYRWYSFKKDNTVYVGSLSSLFERYIAESGNSTNETKQEISKPEVKQDNKPEEKVESKTIRSSKEIHAEMVEEYKRLGTLIGQYGEAMSREGKQEAEEALGNELKNLRGIKEKYQEFSSFLKKFAEN